MTYELVKTKRVENIHTSMCIGGIESIDSEKIDATIDDGLPVVKFQLVCEDASILRLDTADSISINLKISMLGLPPAAATSNPPTT